MITLNNRLDLIWLAGILEGEGCFYLAKYSPRTPTIILQMTDEDIIQRVTNLFNKDHYGTIIPKNNNHKTVYNVDLFGTNAITVMKAILPYMGKRRTAKINEILSASNTRSGQAFGERQGASKISDKEAIEIKELYLNRKSKGLTGQIIAKKYGISQAAVHYIANQRKFPNPKYFTIDFQYSFDF